MIIVRQDAYLGKQLIQKKTRMQLVDGPPPALGLKSKHLQFDSEMTLTLR